MISLYKNQTYTIEWYNQIYYWSSLCLSFHVCFYAFNVHMTKLTLLRHMQRVWSTTSAERASHLSAILKVSKAQLLMIIVGLAILQIYSNRFPIVEITADNTSCVYLLWVCLVREEKLRCSSYAAIRRETEKRIQNISHETLGKERFLGIS
jgi:hypothetical protein